MHIQPDHSNQLLIRQNKDNSNSSNFVTLNFINSHVSFFPRFSSFSASSNLSNPRASLPLNPANFVGRKLQNQITLDQGKPNTRKVQVVYSKNSKNKQANNTDSLFSKKNMSVAPSNSLNPAKEDIKQSTAYIKKVFESSNKINKHPNKLNLPGKAEKLDSDKKVKEKMIKKKEMQRDEPILNSKNKQKEDLKKMSKKKEVKQEIQDQKLPERKIISSYDKKELLMKKNDKNQLYRNNFADKIIENEGNKNIDIPFSKNRFQGQYDELKREGKLLTQRIHSSEIPEEKNYRIIALEYANEVREKLKEKEKEKILQYPQYPQVSIPKNTVIQASQRQKNAMKLNKNKISETNYKNKNKSPHLTSNRERESLMGLEILEIMKARNSIGSNEKEGQVKLNKTNVKRLSRDQVDSEFENYKEALKGRNKIILNELEKEKLREFMKQKYKEEMELKKNRGKKMLFQSIKKEQGLHALEQKIRKIFSKQDEIKIHKIKKQSSPIDKEFENYKMNNNYVQNEFHNFFFQRPLQQEKSPIIVTNEAHIYEPKRKSPSLKETKSKRKKGKKKTKQKHLHLKKEKHQEKYEEKYEEKIHDGQIRSNSLNINQDNLEIGYLDIYSKTLRKGNVDYVEDRKVKDENIQINEKAKYSSDKKRLEMNTVTLSQIQIFTHDDERKSSEKKSNINLHVEVEEEEKEKEKEKSQAKSKIISSKKPEKETLIKDNNFSKLKNAIQEKTQNHSNNYESAVRDPKLEYGINDFRKNEGLNININKAKAKANKNNLVNINKPHTEYENNINNDFENSRISSVKEFDSNADREELEAQSLLYTTKGKSNNITKEKAEDKVGILQANADHDLNTGFMKLNELQMAKLKDFQKEMHKVYEEKLKTITKEFLNNLVNPKEDINISRDIENEKKSSNKIKEAEGIKIQIEKQSNLPEVIKKSCETLKNMAKSKNIFDEQKLLLSSIKFFLVNISEETARYRIKELPINEKSKMDDERWIQKQISEINKEIESWEQKLNYSKDIILKSQSNLLIKIKENIKSFKEKIYSFYMNLKEINSIEQYFNVRSYMNTEMNTFMNASFEIFNKIQLELIAAEEQKKFEIKRKQIEEELTQKLKEDKNRAIRKLGITNSNDLIKIQEQSSPISKFTSPNSSRPMQNVESPYESNISIKCQNPNLNKPLAFRRDFETESNIIFDKKPKNIVNEIKNVNKLEQKVEEKNANIENLKQMKDNVNNVRKKEVKPDAFNILIETFIEKEIKDIFKDLPKNKVDEILRLSDKKKSQISISNDKEKQIKDQNISQPQYSDINQDEKLNEPQTNDNAEDFLRINGEKDNLIEKSTNNDKVFSPLKVLINDKDNSASSSINNEEIFLNNELKKDFNIKENPYKYGQESDEIKIIEEENKSFDNLIVMTNEEKAEKITDCIFNDLMFSMLSSQFYPLRELSLLSQRMKKVENLFIGKNIPCINSNLEAVCEYVEEVCRIIHENPDAFLKRLSMPLVRDPLFVLGQIQNEEPEYYKNVEFEPSQTVLPVDLYLEIEKCRKEGNVDLSEKIQNEWENIHNKCIFDAINDALDYARPYSLKGFPMPWSLLTRELTFRNGSINTLEDVMTGMKEKILTWGSTSAGIIKISVPDCFDPLLPENSEAYINQLNQTREEKLAGLLAFEVNENENNWVEYELEELQTKLDLADMIMEHLAMECATILCDIDQKRIT